MRGTLHLVASGDYGWLVPLVLEPRIANAHRRLRREGVPSDQPAKAVRLIERMLDREGPLTRAEIAQRLRRRAIRTEGQAIAHLVWLAAAEGLICYGPDRDGEPAFTLVRDWIGPSSHFDRQAASAELATRYLTSHGPAEPVDLAAWSGIPLGNTKRAWSAIQDRLTQVETTRGPQWSLRSPRKAETRPDLVRLLPAFDEYLLGWKDRGFAVTPKEWRRINRGGGWLHPVALEDGRAVGTWRTDRQRNVVRIVVEPFSRLEPAVTSGVIKEAADVSRFLGTDIEATIKRAR
jgi:Winged helix DNA-binding domain